MSIPLDVIEKLSEHPNIIGLKDSERDMERLKAAATKFSARHDFSLFCGWTVQSATTLQMGFDGIVPSTGNLIPAMFQQLYNTILEQKSDEVESLQSKINYIADIHQSGVVAAKPIPALKFMMKKYGLCEQWVLPPLTVLQADDEKIISEALQKTDISIPNKLE
jgi:4-hydroxy-tetrahydrodipicolinate synthase